MALTKNIEYKGKSGWNAYAKISRIYNISDYINEEGEKKYTVSVSVLVYTDSTKKFLMDGAKEYTFNEIDAEDISYPFDNLYLKIKELPEWSGWEDC